MESIYEGTWGSSEPAPLELMHYELMREMKWSWAELENTPAYVVRYCWDCMMARRSAESEQAQRQNRRNEYGG